MLIRYSGQTACQFFVTWRMKVHAFTCSLPTELQWSRWFNPSSVALCRRCSEPRWLCVRRDDRRSLDDFPKKGPEFLWKPEEGWPQDPSSPVTISEGDPEVKLDGKVSWHWYLSLFTLWLGTFTEHLPGIDWKRQLRGCYGTAKTCEDLQSVWNQWSRLKPSPSALCLWSPLTRWNAQN